MLWSLHVNMYARVSQYVCMCMSVNSSHSTANWHTVALPADMPWKRCHTCTQTPVYAQTQHAAKKAAPLLYRVISLLVLRVSWLCMLQRTITDTYERWSQDSRSSLDVESLQGWIHSASHSLLLFVDKFYERLLKFWQWNHSEPVCLTQCL